MDHGTGILELAAATRDVDTAAALAETLSGTFYVDRRESHDHLPFRALVTASTDDVRGLESLADVGLYLVFRRLIKPGVPEVIGLFPLVHHPDLSHEEADAHWRDNHGPLALEHHAHMTHYTQLSVVRTLAGRELDGFALCGFGSLEDLRERFYTHADSPGVIAADVRKFADLKKSPPRLIVTEQRFF